MSDPSTTTTSIPRRGPSPKREAPPGSTWAFVDEQVSHIQRGYLRYPPASGARAALAKLRRGLGHEAGTVPEILKLTINPDAPRPHRDEPTADEHAIHAALTLYAVHQQSQNRQMHVRGRSFGSALGRIRYREGAENQGVVRRFQALGTATDLNEAVVHARALVTLLRGAGEAFDYGRFAVDLVRLQHPAHASAVRLAWGRDFYRTRPTAVDEPADSATPTAGTTSEELS